MKNHWVMDYETLFDCFTAVFEDYKTNKTEVFVICRLRNDLPEFIKFLEQNIQNKEWHISYNGLGFDAQVTHYILDNYRGWENLDGNDVALLYINTHREQLRRVIIEISVIILNGKW